VSGRDVELQFGHEPLQSRHLTFRNLEHEARQRARVDDRMLQRALQAAAHEPGVERVVAVLHEHRGLREPEEGTAGVFEHRCSDEHRAIDVVAPLGVGVDRRPAVDERVEEREGLLEREALRAKLEDEERRVAGRLHVEGDELRLVKQRQRGDLRRVDGDLLPRHGLDRAPRLEEERFGAHDAIDSARRAQSISWRVTPRIRSTATR